MDIAALSMGLSQMKVAQQVGISVMKMAMDTAQESTADLTQMMEATAGGVEQAIMPHLGGNIDIVL